MSSPQTPTQASSANLGILIYMAALGVGGAALLVASYALRWGFMGYLGGGILLVASVSMLVGRLRGGVRFVRFECPACRHEQTWAGEALEHGRRVVCKGCFAYLETGPDGALVQTPASTIAETPTFEAPMPASWSMDPACALCGAPTEATEHIEGMVTTLIPGVGRRKVTRAFEVPVCEAHRGQNAVELGAGQYLSGDEGFAVRFRSLAACSRFRERNPRPMEVSSASLSFGRGGARG